MPLDVMQAPAEAPIGARLLPPSRGRVEVHPQVRGEFAAVRLLTAESILALPGEIVSGHPDRHVLRVELPNGRTGYLKKQHRVRFGEKLKNLRAGFGWSSRCRREARVLKQLERECLPAPRWLAFGEDGDGRSFLLVEELSSVAELRRFLSDTALSLADRVRVAEKLGQAIAELHAAGFSTPDLSAKHVFVDPATFAVTLIDWQNSRKRMSSGEELAGLDASLAESLATPRERLRFLWAWTRVCLRSGMKLPRFSQLVQRIRNDSDRMRDRRSIRDQREAPSVDQRLVWVAGEAVCAIPEIAAIWPRPAIAPPFYSSASGMLDMELADGRRAKLIRGRSFTLFNRRTPGPGFGRILFHLQRYGFPAPQLYAFGQRAINRFVSEWFVLFEPDSGRPVSSTEGDEANAQVEYLRQQLRAAGCVVTGSPFVVSESGRVSIGDFTAIRIGR